MDSPLGEGLGVRVFELCQSISVYSHLQLIWDCCINELKKFLSSLFARLFYSETVEL